MITLPLIAEIKDAESQAAARATLDAFREAIQPSTEYGIVLSEPDSNPTVIIKLNQAEASIVSQPPTVKVILIDLNELRKTSDSAAALDLIEEIQATDLPAEQSTALVAEITTAAQYICARCDQPLPLGKDESTPSGSMHDQCAYEITNKKALKTFNSR
jgi:hypothetical protein